MSPRHRIDARSHTRRRRPASLTPVVALTAALAVAVAGIVLGGPVARAAGPAPTRPADLAAAPTGTAATTVTTAGATLTVAVSPDSALPPSGAQIKVAGKGFDPAHDLWIAICQDDGAAPAALVHCIGGAIPDQNSTAAWGVVTSAKQPPYAGPVTTSWRQGGSFELTLQVLSALGQDADCISAPCSVYTRSSDDTDRSQDVRVPVAFAAPPGGSSSGAATTTSAAPATTEAPSTSTSAAPTTRTIGGVATTVSPEMLQQTSVTAGGQQTVLFSGFTPGEKVDVTLYSAPVTLPTATADPNGNVRIVFTVPKDLAPGEHLLQAIGRQSGRVGIAQFTVGAPPTTASASATSPSSAASTSTVAPSSAAVSSVPSSVATSASQAPTSQATTPTAASSSAAVAAPGGTGNRLLWLWIVLAILVIVGGTAGLVAMVRNRRQTDDEIPSATAQPVPPAAPGWAPGGAAHDPPTVRQDPGGPAGGFGLLSGRDHPDGPALLSGGGWADQPTRALGDAGGGQGSATEQWRPDFAGGQPAGGQGPATEQWRPDFAGGQPAGGGEGPATEQWRPDFAGGQPAGGEGPAPDDGPGPGRHRS